MYFAHDLRHAVNSSSLVRPSSSVLHGRPDVERAPLVRSFSDSLRNDKTEPTNLAATAKSDQQHQRQYTAASSPSSAAVHPRPSPPSEAAEAASRGRSILEYYTQIMPLSAACQSMQKRCTIVGCAKISVSRGLCRGHGGGRRCHFKGGCTKSAQSRSMFCWAHGGGQRCDVPQCMRSRKSKRFCVTHLHLEQTAASSDKGVAEQPQATRMKKTQPRMPLRAVNGDADDDLEQRRRMSRSGTSSDTRRRLLPSLRQALTDASRTLPNLPRRAPRAFCA